MSKTVLTQTGAKVQEDLDFNENLVNEFSAENTYELGDVVRYQDKIYKCHTAVTTAGEWTGGDNWTEKNIENLLLDQALYDGVSFDFQSNAGFTISANNNYASYVRIVGKVLFMVVSFNITKDSGASDDPITIGQFGNIPDEVFDGLVGNAFLDEQSTRAYVDGTFTSVVAKTALVKGQNHNVSLRLETENLVANTQYHIRHMSTFLLTNNFFQSTGVRINGLGNATPTNVTFSKSTNFPTEAQAWEEVTIGSDKFAKFTTWYRKSIYEGSELKGIIMSNVQEDESFVPYDCFLDESGNVLPYILIGRYCMSSTETANSVDASRATMTIGAGRTLARAKGTGYQLMDVAMQIFWRDLALAISQNVNFNNGAGVASYLGLARMTEGGWWVDGLAHVDNKYLYSNKPSKYTDQPTSATDGYDELGYDMPTESGGCISKLGYDAEHPTVNLPSATVSNGSYNTYYCDGLWYASGNRPCYVAVGGAGAYSGLFYLDGSGGWSGAYGVRLAYKPPIQ